MDSHLKYFPTFITEYGHYNNKKQFQDELQLTVYALERRIKKKKIIIQSSCRPEQTKHI